MTTEFKERERRRERDGREKDNDDTVNPHSPPRERRHSTSSRAHDTEHQRAPSRESAFSFPRIQVPLLVWRPRPQGRREGSRVPARLPAPAGSIGGNAKFDVNTGAEADRFTKQFIRDQAAEGTTLPPALAAALSSTTPPSAPIARSPPSATSHKSLTAHNALESRGSKRLHLFMFALPRSAMSAAGGAGRKVVDFYRESRRGGSWSSSTRRMRIVIETMAESAEGTGSSLERIQVKEAGGVMKVVGRDEAGERDFGCDPGTAFDFWGILPIWPSASLARFWRPKPGHLGPFNLRFYYTKTACLYLSPNFKPEDLPRFNRSSSCTAPLQYFRDYTNFAPFAKGCEDFPESFSPSPNASKLQARMTFLAFWRFPFLFFCRGCISAKIGEDASEY
ncbi:hypothetical protein C8F04DRAFT_1239354 [Mycena alexandri]|uniref:Uncharacterized protein n=1 Tax=Mycena alexandri TaxID=1745969 RepID=A0AAD6WS51_9AGAR|nr:hypothetical protein C8F04DRAFT_1239354 [Mycena alexandri]